jgi:hypothetical protein
MNMRWFHRQAVGVTGGGMAILSISSAWQVIRQASGEPRNASTPAS